jgi:hypothetical protein
MFALSKGALRREDERKRQADEAPAGKEKVA